MQLEGNSTARLTRSQFQRCFHNSASRWSSWKRAAVPTTGRDRCRALGIEVRLLPARYIRAYVKRNKTDAADAAALLEAARCADIRPVRIKSVEQQALQSLHRTRSLWMSTRTARINALRGFCREFGIDIAQGARLGMEQIARALADPNSLDPELLRSTMRSMIDEIRLLEVRISDLEKQLGELARQSAACTTLLSVPGVGLLTATAMVAATSGEVSHFKRRAPLRRLVRPDSQGALLRSDSPHRSHLQARRSIPAHAAHARRSRRAQCRQRRAPECSAPSIRYGAGRCRSSNAAITTRPSARSPTNSRASAMPCCVITSPMAPLA